MNAEKSQEIAKLETGPICLLLFFLLTAYIFPIDFFELYTFILFSVSQPIGNHDLHPSNRPNYLSMARSHGIQYSTAEENAVRDVSNCRCLFCKHGAGIFNTAVTSKQYFIGVANSTDHHNDHCRNLAECYGPRGMSTVFYSVYMSTNNCMPLRLIAITHSSTVVTCCINRDGLSTCDFFLFVFVFGNCSSQ